MIDVEKLKLILPENLLFEMQGTFERFSINTILRISHFIAQVKHESGDFTFTQENLNYSAVGLMNVFGKYFPDKATANAYARQPEKIANKVYSNRMGNGDEASGDGWKFKGRGYIQLTGKDNYTAFAKAMNDEIVLITPELLNMKKYACLSAGFFWDKNKLNDIADKGNTDAVVQMITKKVNGGLNGITDRIKNFKLINSKLI